MGFEQISLKGRALRLLAGREHSRAELEKKLKAHEAEPGELQRALDELQAKGFIDEQRVVDSVLHRIDLPVGVSPAAVTDAASGDLSGTALPVVPVAPAGLDDGSFHRMIDQWRRGTPGAAPRHQGS